VRQSKGKLVSLWGIAADKVLKNYFHSALQKGSFLNCEYASKNKGLDGLLWG
jgi:hypothetical protein